MSIEKPTHKEESIHEAAPEKETLELSEHEQQAAHENVCRERFIQDWVMTSELTPEQKVFVSEYINTEPGAWREYNGTDFKVVEALIEDGVWRLSFGVYFDDYEAQRIEVEIPLAAT